jgi:uncharacterized protein YfaS (alpha-2-macroglobulin family)
MEQTASAAYPNVLVAEYLEKAGSASKEKRSEARALVAEGVQRILSFQGRDGGFGWWSGGADPQVWVTAYAIHILRDSARVVDVDERPVERARAWLRSRRSGRGWGEAGRTHGVVMDGTALTAYVAWALGGDDAAADELEKHVDGDDAYRLALVTLALAESGRMPAARRAAARLAQLEWRSQGTLSYGRGECGAVETSGLAVQALFAAGVGAERAQKGIEALVAKRRDGDWGSTQATVQALRALTGASSGGRAGEKVTVAFRAGGRSRSLELALGEAAVPSVDLTELLGAGPIEVEGPAHVGLQLQAVARHFEPWKREAGELKLEVEHPDAWSVGKPVRMSVTARGRGRMVVAEVGLAPGAAPSPASLEALAASKRVSRYEVRPDRVVFYLSSLEAEARLDFEVTPRMAGEARVRPGRVYEFYAPDGVAVVATAKVTIAP